MRGHLGRQVVEKGTLQVIQLMGVAIALQAFMSGRPQELQQIVELAEFVFYWSEKGYSLELQMEMEA